MITCPECGKELADGARFCKFCGQPLLQIPSPSSWEGKVPVQNLEPTSPAPKKKKSTKIVLIAIISIILVVAIVLGIIFIPDLIGKKKDEDLTDKDKLTQLLEESTTKPIVEFVYDDYDSDGTYEAYAVVGETDEEDEKHPEFYDADIYFVNLKKAQPIKENISGKSNGKINLDEITYISIEVYEDGTDEGKSFIYTVDGTKSDEADISGEYSNVHEENGKVIGFDENGNEVEVDLAVKGADEPDSDEFENIVEPTDEDWVEFEYFLCNFFETYSPADYFDYESENALEQAHLLLLGHTNSHIHSYFFADYDNFDSGFELYEATYDEASNNYYHEVVDPLGKFEDSYVYLEYSADEMDWIVKNVFNLTPDRNYSDDLCYYYDDSFYMPGGYAGGGYYTYSEKTISSLGDGVYSYSANVHVFEDTVPSATVTATVALKEIEGKKFWSVYKFERQSLENYY